MSAVRTSDNPASELSKERERLEKLWDAYEIQEREFREAEAKINLLGKQLKEKDKIIEGLKSLLAQRDEEIRELQLEKANLRNVQESEGSASKDLKAQVADLRNKYRKLFTLAEDLESELSNAYKGIEKRDDWFNSYIGTFLNMQPAIKERKRFITEAEQAAPTEGRVARMESDMDTFAAEPEPAETSSATSEATKAPDMMEEEDELEEIGLGREDLIDVFMMIPSVTRTMAESLFDAGYKDIEDLKEAEVGDLAVLKGFNPTMARLVKKDIEMM